MNVHPTWSLSPPFLFGLQVFFLENEDQRSGLSDPADHSRLTEHVAKAFCLALCPHLKLLKEDGMTRLGLRVALDSEQVILRELARVLEGTQPLTAVISQ